MGSNEFVAQARKEGRPVWHMGCGESPFSVHPRLRKALAENVHHKRYEQTVGAEALRDQIKAYYHEKASIDPNKFDIVMGPGSKMLLYTLQHAVQGDLLHVVPSWVSYAPQARLCGDNVIDVPMTLDDGGLHIDPNALRDVIAAARSKGLNPSKIVLNSPSNPTGLKIPPAEFEGLAEVFREEKIFVIWDDIYGLVNFDGEYEPFINMLPEQTALTSAVSKHLSLGGWRAGFAFVPRAIPELLPYLRNYSSETWSAVAAPIQHALVEAYKGHDDIEEYIKECAQIHGFVNKYVAQQLRDAGIETPMPSGAFYCYPNFEEQRSYLEEKGVRTGQDLANYLMEKESLVALPGIAFGEDNNKLILRLSAIDYDADPVYEAFKAGTSLDEAFLRQYTPRVVEATEKIIRSVCKAKSA